MRDVDSLQGMSASPSPHIERARVCVCVDQPLTSPAELASTPICDDPWSDEDDHRAVKRASPWWVGGEGQQDSEPIPSQPGGSL